MFRKKKEKLVCVQGSIEQPIKQKVCSQCKADFPPTDRYEDYYCEECHYIKYGMHMLRVSFDKEWTYIWYYSIEDKGMDWFPAQGDGRFDLELERFDFVLLLLDTELGTILELEEQGDRGADELASDDPSIYLQPQVLPSLPPPIRHHAAAPRLIRMADCVHPERQCPVKNADSRRGSAASGVTAGRPTR